MIDAVLTWVDGNDPVLKAERRKYLTANKEDTLNDIAGRDRFIQSDEIRFAVASILRFAPYIGRIFIVTNGQDPDLGAFLTKNFPESEVEIRVINQNILFSGYEEYSPVFNSLAVEVLLYRIPDLSEEFVYMNDDFFFASPSKKEDLFSDGKVVCYSVRYSALICKILRFIRMKKRGHKRLTYKDTLLNGAELLGAEHLYRLPHEPHPILKSLLEDYFKEHPEAVLRNVRHRFRDKEQFNVQGFFYLLAEKTGRFIHKSPKGRVLMIRKTSDKKNYLERKLRTADNSPRLMFGCVNALQDSSPKDKSLFEKWICDRLQITL